jgi:opacity protein-like surface antigen
VYKTFCLILILFFVSFGCLTSKADASGDKWTFEVIPYIWAANVEGDLAFTPEGSTGAPEVEVGPVDYLKKLDAAAMLAVKVRRDRLALITDFIYLDFSNENSTVKSVTFLDGTRIPISASLDAGTKSSLEGILWTLLGGYDLNTGDKASTLLVAGARYFRIEATIDWQLTTSISGPLAGQTFPASSHISETKELWDGIVGAQGKLNLGQSHFYIPYHFDIGAGSSELTWQIVAGLGYDFSWLDISLLYRHLAYETKESKILENIRFSGPTLGINISF